jgi:choline monooxygenase
LGWSALTVSEVYGKGKEHVRLSISYASTLPREAYVSEDWFDVELSQIFAKTWMWVGRVGQVAKAGDFFTTKIGYDPLLIVRESDEKIRGLINVCRHRGALVVPKTNGNAKSFVCPYHNWTYGLDGALRGCPGLDWSDMEGVEGFDPKTFGLHEVRVETWQGSVFINFDMKAPPLSRYLGDLVDELSRWQLQNLVPTKHISYNLDVNWKIFADNMTEQYHVPYLHRETLYNGLDIEIIPHDNWLVWYDTNKAPVNYLDTAGANPLAPVINGVTQEDMKHVWFYHIYPNSFFLLTPYMLAAFNIIPTGLKTCTSVVDYFFPDPNATSPQFLQGNYDLVERILFKEDIPVQETVQAGLMSNKGFRDGDGRLSVKFENGLYHFHNWILDRMNPAI